MSRKVAVLTTIVLLAALTTGVLAASQREGGERATCTEIPHGPEARKCYVDEIYSKDASVVELFAKVDLLLGDPQTAAHFTLECHEVLHDLGKRAEEEHGPLSLDEAPVDSCVNGFQHGVLEVRLGGVGDEELVRGRSSWCVGEDAALCLHLLGHVAMRRSLAKGEYTDAHTYTEQVCANGATPDSSREVALHEFRCLDGAYMEWTVWLLRQDPGAIPEHPEAICRDLINTSKVAASACYSQIGLLLYEKAGTESAAFNVCKAEAATVGEALGNMCIFAVANAVASFSEDVVAAATEFCSDIDQFTCAVGFERSRVGNAGLQAKGEICTAVVPNRRDECVDASMAPYPFVY
jgi:hypothetical protein